MARDSGTFIVIEGTDGSGKTTQFQKLAKRLAQEGHEVATFDFPQYEQPSSYFVRQYLNGEYGSGEDVGPYTGSLFYALDRYEAAPHIRTALEQGKIVLSNRFVGSSMAHQGTKFTHAEERRGYFIWLDNLEFEMLKIPRPTMSLVLRVPAAIAQQLVDQKAARSYTNKKRDLHEADIAHLQKAVEVYDDMCQLFPKDFSCIDCTRDNQLMEVDTIQDIIWQKIQPLLPAKPSKKALSAVRTPTALMEAPASADIRTVPQLPTVRLTLDTASSLLASKLRQTAGSIKLSQPVGKIDITEKVADGGDGTRYHTPELQDKLHDQYTTYMDQIWVKHTAMLQKLTEYIAKGNTDTEQTGFHAEAATALRSVLPVASTLSLTIEASGPALERLITSLLDDILPETQAVGMALLTEARQSGPHFLPSIQQPGQAPAETPGQRARVQLAKVAAEQLPISHGKTVEAVQLIEASPRNELDILPDVLYPHTDLSFKELQKTVSRWPYAKKAEVLETCLRAHNPAQRPPYALERVHYAWDLLCPYDIFRDAQHHHLASALEWQLLTPRYGYEVPNLIEAADLVEDFEGCFDLSLRLYSSLQEAGLTAEAQYATLGGHNIRWKAAYTAPQVFSLLAQAQSEGSSPGYRQLAAQLHQKMSEAHSLIAESMPSNNSVSDPLKR